MVHAVPKTEPVRLLPFHMPPHTAHSPLLHRRHRFHHRRQTASKSGCALAECCAPKTTAALPECILLLWLPGSETGSRIFSRRLVSKRPDGTRSLEGVGIHSDPTRPAARLHRSGC